MNTIIKKSVFLLRKRIFLRLLAFGLFLFVATQSKAQSYIADTLVIRSELLQGFNTLSQHVISCNQRDLSDKFLSLFEKKKWIFFPIDQVVECENDISTLFSNNPQNASYTININQLYIKNTESLFSRKFATNAAFELYDNQLNSDPQLIGTFYYEQYTKQKIKDSILHGYAESMNTLNQSLKNDLEAVWQGKDTSTNESFHFRRGYAVAPKNFYISTDVYYGIGFWGFDVELYFSSPEPSKKFKRKSGMLRFMQHENRQTAAIARNVQYYNIRLNEKWLFQNKHAFLLGFNRWNDIDEEKRTLEEIFLLQLSAVQKITYNPLDKSAFVFGLGLYEDLSYVVYNKPMFNLAIVANIGFKF